MFTDKIIVKLKILVKSLYDEDIYDNVLTPLYNFDNNYVNQVFSYTHLKINDLVNLIKNRIAKNNRYMISAMRSLATELYEIIKQLKSFFEKENMTLLVNQKYEVLLSYISNMSQEFGREAYFDESYLIPSLVLDEIILDLKLNNNFDSIKYLIFGADKTKPDIVIKDVLDGKLDVINDKDLLVYNGDISNSFLYKDFNKWWNKVSADKYKDYKSSLNAIEQKVADYYKSNFKKDEFPVLIPQVYLHYDPKNQKFRRMIEDGSILTFQRMDFLIIYRGKRVIIEIDGETHTPENNLEKYSKQCKYDRDMRFLGYDVFRLGGFELTFNFEYVVRDFFDKLFNYLNVNSYIN